MIRQVVTSFPLLIAYVVTGFVIAALVLFIGGPAPAQVDDGPTPVQHHPTIGPDGKNWT